ncbi:uncharacterized protein LOC121256322 isoform X2 [Juglans microcarpa x Juglans regia]|uniref:uncharacterized protein LOC121256322 isoform X2 n=1 Tax=Juglans microcarpa x Juglans regia TaxID=2249226 RepID=UPI001B7E12EC|nr:uncharacterized protein LOC121256322 isoform X2 [Juglans microcarpa x Juglans regia]
MVCAGLQGERETVRRPEKTIMAMEPERSKALHNFTLPLKWGNQRYLRCMKVSPDGGVGVDRRSLAPTLESSPVTRRRELERKRKRDWKSGIESGGGGGEGIEAVRKEVLFDLKTAVDKMKVEIFRKEVEEEEEEIEEDEEIAEANQSPPADESARPWNLRTRRAACKAPIGGGKGLRIEEKKVNSSPLRSENNGVRSPRLRGGGGGGGGASEKKEKKRTKLTVPLTRKEIEEDFIEFLGHRPPRRPKKRLRNVQKQLDSLFPGLWLSDITVDSYKVPEAGENGKR